MRFSTLIAFMLPLSALGQLCPWLQSDVDFSTKVFYDGYFKQASFELVNMWVDSGNVSVNMAGAFEKLRSIFGEAASRPTHGLPSKEECVDTPHWSG